MSSLKPTIACAAAVFAASALPLDAIACGESLFRVGRGVAYREYTAPLPAKILVVARTEGELALVERLAAAGHDMRVVTDASSIRAELETEAFDIVMTRYEHRLAVESLAPSPGSRFAYLPVARDDSAEHRAARTLNAHAPTTADDVKAFLKAIHRTLKEGASA